MTKAEFVAKYRYLVAGGFLYGYLEERKLPATKKAEKAASIPAEVEALLEQMFEDITCESKTQTSSPSSAEKPSVNGVVRQQVPSVSTPRISSAVVPVVPTSKKI